MPIDEKAIRQSVDKMIHSGHLDDIVDRAFDKLAPESTTANPADGY